MNAKGWSIVGGVAVALCAASYLRGHLAGARAERASAAVRARADSLKHNAERLRAAAVVVDSTRTIRVAAVARDSSLRVARAPVRAKVRVLSDSTFEIVNGLHFAIPEVVALIRHDDAVIAQGEITQRAQAAELEALYRRDTLHVERERLQDEQLADLKPERCGVRCGFVAGVTLAIAVTHPAEVAKLARAVWRFVAP